MTKPLSPAAQAVLDAIDSQDGESDRAVVVAAIRALADHKTPKWDGTGPACFWRPTQDTRRELRNIADELEGHHG